MTNNRAQLDTVRSCPLPFSQVYALLTPPPFSPDAFFNSQLAEALCRYETLSADEVREVLQGRELPGRDVAIDALAGPTL